MRVILDTNISISSLLTGHRASTIRSIIRAAVSGRFTLLLPHELGTEFEQKVAGKPYLRDRIPPEAVADLIDILRQSSEIIPHIYEEFPAISRDVKDTYILAYGLIGRADYLVSGDDDLLILGQIDTMKNISPADFVGLLLRE